VEALAAALEFAHAKGGLQKLRTIILDVSVARIEQLNRSVKLEPRSGGLM
jgi:hypothetical protein